MYIVGLITEIDPSPYASIFPIGSRGDSRPASMTVFNCVLLVCSQLTNICNLRLRFRETDSHKQEQQRP